MESVLTSWPIVFFWPAVVMGLMLSALGLVWRRSSLPTAGAIVTLPAALYLSATPRFQFVGFVPVACLLLSRSVANDRLRHRLIGSARVSTAAGSPSLAVPCDALQTAATRDLCVSNSQFSR